MGAGIVADSSANSAALSVVGLGVVAGGRAGLQAPDLVGFAGGAEAVGFDHVGGLAEAASQNLG
ncbi:hypothetical protein GCM10027087_02550 [Paractinoplanes abujensis]